MQTDWIIRTRQDLCDAVERLGIVPLFRNSIPGFSVEEHVAPEAWFDSGQDGVWEWKGPVIRETGCAYGRFFEKKTAFVRADWFAELANFRRSGYDFDARFDEGLAPFADHALFSLVQQHGPILSRRLKRLGDYRKGGRTGFDISMNRLQSQCYVTISDFVYELDRRGVPYGWGVAEYALPEQVFGAAFSEAVYAKTPEASYARLFAHLQALLPGADQKSLEHFLR